MRLRQDVRDWVAKAEEDFAVVRTLVRKRRPTLNNAVCFHAQQCAEKYLKAFLTRERIAFPKTHDLLDLLELASPAANLLELLRSHLEYLEPYAVQFRYPGEHAHRAEAQRAAQVTGQVRDRLRDLLSLS